jgi:diguanylate cyclase (GGDEF)-like protein
MLNAFRRLTGTAQAHIVSQLGAMARGRRKAPATDQELLDAIWEALNIARDNKALVVARDGIIININHLASQLCGRTLAELIGRRVVTELFEDPPVPQTAAAPERWETKLRTASSFPIPVEVIRQPLGTQLQGLKVYAIRDLRERRAAVEQREQLIARLGEQHEQLDAALENIPQGLAMFDAEQRLIVCNQRYADMYGLTAQQVKPGTTTREILQYRISNGCYYIRDTEKFVDSWAGDFGEVSSRIQELADGRIISVMRRRLAKGHLLVTHEDVTERQKLHDRLEQQHKLLAQQNMRFRAALDNMGEGLCMFDADKRLVVCNDRYAKMYQLPPDLLEVGTPHNAIIAHRVSHGILKGDTGGAAVEEKIVTLGQLPATTISSRTDELADGRLICVTRQPMTGGGWVATHDDVTEQRRSEAKISHMALHDALTDLPNRALLNEHLEHALARVKRGEIVATHLLDLDYFKNVNDTLGHPVGDKLLTMVAERLRGLIRDADTIARMGGDEFAILQLGIAQPSDATSLAQRVIEVVGEPYDIDGHQVIIGTSIGIAVGPADGLSPDPLLRNADLALYRAKSHGRGTVCFFESEMDAQMQARRALEQDLRKAFIGREFELHYQPIINLETDEISGFEALIRWPHSERGMVPPNTFIPLAEEIGLIVPLGEWALRTACSTAARWPDHLKICVNLSPVQFRTRGLVQMVVGALATSGLHPARLELEITETVLLIDTEATLTVLHRLRELGVRIAMDDFGTGYSSLSYLQTFPFDRIKIDRSFVKGVAEEVGSLNIVRAVAAMAKGLGMATTAEGVETQEQLDAVKSEGCGEMQGFLFSPALPAHEIEQLLLSTQKKAENAA